MTLPPKSARRSIRANDASGTLTEAQIRRLEQIFDNSLGMRNPSQKNVHSLLNIRSTHSQHRRDRHNSALGSRIVINVSGSRYETHRTTLELYPDTLLGNAELRKYYYDRNREEYFFDRHRGCFEAILYFYQSHGRLRRPDFVSLDIFFEEVTFFRLGDEALAHLRKNENIEEVKKVRPPKNRIRKYIWATLDYPDYSLLAKIVNVISLLMILTSTITFAIESLPEYTSLDDLNCQRQFSIDSSTNSTLIANMTDLNSTTNFYVCHLYYVSPFFLIQAVCVGFFTIEFLLRISTTPSILGFIRSPMNWIDSLAIIPFYITLGVQLSGQQNDFNSNKYIGLRFLRVLRLARVFKIFRVFKSVKSLRVLATTIRQSLLDFLAMIIILTLLGFLFGAAAYYAENDSNSPAFDSIVKGTYWGIVTITSVGYGDITPITPVGRVIACLCALSGAATIGMLVSVLVDRYQRVYNRKLYAKEEPIDFEDYSDDEDNESEGGNTSFIVRHRINSRIEDPDARAKENAEQENDDSIALPRTSDWPTETSENSHNRRTSRVHFILGYVDNDNPDISDELLTKIHAVVVDKQSTSENISLNLISDEDSLLNVQLPHESVEDDAYFVAIPNTPSTKRNVQKTSPHSPFHSSENSNLSEENLSRL